MKTTDYVIEAYKYLKGIYKVGSSSILPLVGPKTFEATGYCLQIQNRYCPRLPHTADLIFFNSGVLPNTLHYITLQDKTESKFLGLSYCKFCVACEM